MIVPTVRQTKFLLAVFLLLAATGMATASLWLQAVGKAVFMDANMWWVVALSVFTAYGASDVVNTHLQQSKNVRPEDQTS